jgi:hypothetical protein
MNFNFRIKDLEVHSCNDSLLTHLDNHTTACIVKWEKDKENKDYCFVIANWVKQKEGYELKL